MMCLNVTLYRHHVVLCFSPVGDLFRIRAMHRRFPVLINCTSIDWFHAWPVSHNVFFRVSVNHLLQGVTIRQ